MEKVTKLAGALETTGKKALHSKMFLDNEKDSNRIKANENLTEIKLKTKILESRLKELKQKSIQLKGKYSAPDFYLDEGNSTLLQIDELYENLSHANVRTAEL